MSTAARANGNGLEEACNEITSALTERPGEWLRAREIKAATGLSDGRFTEAMKRLRESERIRMEGQRAGARYLLADDGVPTEVTDATKAVTRAKADGTPEEAPQDTSGQVEPPPSDFAATVMEEAIAKLEDRADELRPLAAELQAIERRLDGMRELIAD